VGDELCDALLGADQGSEAGISGQRERVTRLRARLASLATAEARRLDALADYLVRKSVWIVGGDGWAYDIGFGGLDHVLAVGRDVNVLVLDTEVYSNTGGQQSKATPIGAAAKFAVAGKGTAKKDLAAMAISYGHVYVARVAFGAKDAHTVRVLQEAESYPGPSLVIAYSPCIAHGYDLEHSLDQQKLAIESGYWPLYRFDPRREATGENPFVLDSAAPKVDLGTFTRNEARFRLVEQQNPDRFRALIDRGRADIRRHFETYEAWSTRGDAPKT
jgi:pyruvate-ferredoxin/flavodoxin oxidoreductase